MPLSRSRKNDHDVFDAMPKLAIPRTPARKNALYSTPARPLVKPSDAFTPMPNTSRYPSGYTRSQKMNIELVARIFASRTSTASSAQAIIAASPAVA